MPEQFWYGYRMMVAAVVPEDMPDFETEIDSHGPFSIYGIARSKPMKENVTYVTAFHVGR